MVVLYILLGILAAALLCFAVVLLLSCRHRKSHPLLPLLQKTSFAHRGLHGQTAPENSLSAIKMAADKGYGIEFDLHLTSDDRLAVIHDGTLTRTCGVEMKVCTNRLADLRRHPLSNGEPIPSFEEVLGAVDGRVPLLIELKNDGDNAKELVAACLSCLEGYKDNFCIESFDCRVLLELKKQAPHIARGQLSCNYLKTRGRPFYQRVFLHTMLTNAMTKPDFVAYKQADQRSLPCRAAKAAGIPLFFWTLREKELALEEIKKGNAVIFEKFEL